MAGLLDLANELLILIMSHISKPSHILQIALVNKQINAIALQHLYANVTFDRDNYPPVVRAITIYSQQGPGLYVNPPVRRPHTLPHPNIRLLSSMIRSNTLPAGRIVTGLTINVAVNHESNMFQTSLSLLLPQLSSLRQLTLKSVLEDRYGVAPEIFSLAPLGPALSHTSGTLERLSMHFFRKPENGDGWTIGSLRHFPKLEHLSVQANVLLGDCELDAFPSSRMRALHTLLPPGLKFLRLIWCGREGIVYLRCVLVALVKESLAGDCEMEELVVCLDATAKDVIEESDVELLKGTLANFNDEVRPRGLNLRMKLEWTQDHCFAIPMPPDLSFMRRSNRGLS